MSLKDLVKDEIVQFQYYRDGNLWYKIKGGKFEFPVPTSEAGNAIFLKEDKAILFMRYIRKQMELQEQARNANVG